MFNFVHLDILCLWVGIRVKSYDHLNFSRASVLLFRASQYIIGLNPTPESNVKPVWILFVLPCLISSISIYYVPKSDIQVKKYEHLTFSRVCVVQFWATRYIIGLDQKSELKIMAVWICLVLPCLISSISIYSAPESDFRVKSYDHLNFSRAYIVQFWATRYVTGLNRTSESKVMAIWLCLVLPGLISSISTYYAPESDIRVKCYDHLNF